VRNGSGGCPDAVCTPLGWSLLGPAFKTVAAPDNETSCFVAHVSATVPQSSMQVMFLEDESDVISMDGEFDDSQDDVRQHAMSEEDRRTYALMKQSIEYINGHYQLPLPWPCDYQILPDNIDMARKRLTGLKRRFQRNPEVHQKYTDQMRLSIEKGNAEEVPEDEIDADRRKWYIPYHGVFSEQKPDKLRIIFDCAAQHHGVSLNQVLLQGPDLNNRLDAVLLRFRKESTALVADVEAMFRHVLVSPRDRYSLRFLWWRDGDFTKEAIPHRMKIHLFGATCSPSCAAFSLRQAALDFGHGYEPLVASTVERATYVDDVLTAVSDVETGIKLVDRLRLMLAKAGFRLTKWLSNDERILASLPEKELAKSVQTHSIDSSLQERVIEKRIYFRKICWIVRM